MDRRERLADQVASGVGRGVRVWVRAQVDCGLWPAQPTSPVMPCHTSHLVMVTTVPLPGAEWMSNSSMSHLAPGNPTPSPFALE